MSGSNEVKEKREKWRGETVMEYIGKGDKLII